MQRASPAEGPQGGISNERFTSAGDRPHCHPISGMRRRGTGSDGEVLS